VHPGPESTGEHDRRAARTTMTRHRTAHVSLGPVRE
jgi:hypothetical protein